MSGHGLKGNVLDLDSDCLSAPSRLHVAIVEAVMLWPTDASARETALQTSTVEFLRLNRSLRDADLGFDQFELGAGAQPIKEMAEPAKSPFVYGIISGYVLAETVGKIRLDLPQASIGHSIEIASKTFWPRWRVSVKTINNSIWPGYKSVSPLWAAYWMRVTRGAALAFPCTNLELSEFLAEADAYRRLGESLRTFKAPAPLLAADTAVRTPFELPSVSLGFELKSAQG